MTKVEELREPVYNDVAHYLNDCGHGYNSEEEAAAEIDSLIAAAKAEGAALEHEFIFNMIRASCRYPIDGDKLFSETLPVCYGDALPIKEPPCSG